MRYFRRNMPFSSKLFYANNARQARTTKFQAIGKISIEIRVKFSCHLFGSIQLQTSKIPLLRLEILQDLSAPNDALQQRIVTPSTRRKLGFLFSAADFILYCLWLLKLHLYVTQLCCALFRAGVLGIRTVYFPTKEEYCRFSSPVHGLPVLISRCTCMYHEKNNHKV